MGGLLGWRTPLSTHLMMMLMAPPAQDHPRWQHQPEEELVIRRLGNSLLPAGPARNPVLIPMRIFFINIAATRRS
jgi:hypothetical protein